MLRANQSFAYGFFSDEHAAAGAVQQLLSADFDSEHIGVLMLDGNKGVTDVRVNHKTAVGTGIAVGGLLGATVAAIAVPGLGLLAFGGAFAHLAAAAAGGAAGSLLGSLGGLGVWSDEVNIPKQAFERGDVLVGVLVPEDQADRARSVLTQAGATQTALSTRAEAEADLMKQKRRVEAV
jgi:hypothetical protein